jgi:hypothetical protein
LVKLNSENQKCLFRHFERLRRQREATKNLGSWGGLAKRNPPFIHDKAVDYAWTAPPMIVVGGAPMVQILHHFGRFWRQARP